MTDPVERVARAVEAADQWEPTDWAGMARAAIAAMPGEPVAWQKRPTFGDRRIWTECGAGSEDEDQEFWREQDYELRPLYAAPAMPATDAVREAIQYLRDIESHMMANDIDMEMGDLLPPSIVADKLDAALSHASQGGWQPISTAPKDGTKVDLLYPYPRGRTNDCKWLEGGVYGDGGWYWLTPLWRSYPGLGIGQHLVPESEWNVNSYPNDEPTHWRDVPAPPEVQP